MTRFIVKEADAELRANSVSRWLEQPRFSSTENVAVPATAKRQCSRFDRSVGKRSSSFAKRARKSLALICAAFLLVVSSRVATPQAAAPAGAVRFRAVDVFIDAGDKPLAAYQFEVKAKTGHVLLVGVEGGEHPAFKAAPYYDPAALLGGDAAGDRIVVAAFNTGADLPRGKTRVARLHVQLTGDADPTYESTLQVSAGADGQNVPATLSLSPSAVNGTSKTSPASSQGVTP